ncbi:nascent polypeptide-associated complex subunit alpha, muscle-specific form-like [Thrips palmi]|uniref:Nascent polypeptide-associated complex subunit alpha, muscle-specific form-like n=1 Tax=Thrips palmi TaxID=161013 RepID=A0A6P8YV20_THRPL|nr:nascent polypeptide-associated complex subunit alpha, muscle-specific form-like [Thrips palmi]XP_034243927.1 nascent polypeptide-associated complex subunit alpha, muscle-specific form-like [Thrips palmi]XP_034243928.1 nascent polypeptide-associated complex subunit alpha, muscle-specific form-like [Thrips palmi]
MRLTWQLAVLVLSAAVAAVGVLGAPGPPPDDGLLGPPADQLPMEARDSELELEDDPSPPHSAALLGPATILNGGKPFFADKDPVTGQLDLSAAKVEPAEPPPQDDYDYEEHDGIDRKDTAGTRGRPNDLDSQGALKIVTPNFHDFLNLPVKYSSAGDKYPLISSSYANTKVQGMGASSASSNSASAGSIKNHKPYSPPSSTVPAPHYYTLPTTTATTPAPFTASTTTARTTPRTTTTTTTTTTPAPTTVTRRPSVPPTSVATTRRPTPKPTTASSFWSLLESEEYPEPSGPSGPEPVEPPQSSFGMKPPREEGPSVDYGPDYSYDDEYAAPPPRPPQAPALSPRPQNSHQPPAMGLLTTDAPVPASKATTPASTSTSTTTTTTTKAPTTTSTTTTSTTTTTVRPTTRRPQLSTVMILKPFNRKPVVVTAQSSPSTTTTSTSPAPTSTTTTTTTPAPTSAEASSTTSAAPTTSNVVLVPERPSAGPGTSNKVVFEQAPPRQPSAPNAGPAQRPPPVRPQSPYPGPPRPQQQGPIAMPPPLPPRDSPYGMAANQPFRPLYDRRPGPPPGFLQQGAPVPPPGPVPPPAGLPPSGYGDLITDAGGDNNYVSFSFQPPSPQQLRPPPGPPRFPGVEPPRPNPPGPFRQPPPSPPPRPTAVPTAQTAQTTSTTAAEREGAVPPANDKPEKQQQTTKVPSTTKAPPPASSTSRFVFPDEKRDKNVNEQERDAERDGLDTKEIVVHGSFQHPSQRPHGAAVQGQGQGQGQVMDAPPPFRRPPPQTPPADMMPPFALDSDREGSEQQPAYELPPPHNAAAANAAGPVPATDLMPPADPGKIRGPPPSTDWPRPHWETVQGPAQGLGHNGRPKQPYPQGLGQQGLRPKLDTMPPPLGGPGPANPNLGPGHRILPPGGAVPPGYKVHKQDTGLPNILPQFRPNARLSGHPSEQQHGMQLMSLKQYPQQHQHQQQHQQLHQPMHQPMPQRMPLMERPGEGRPLPPHHLAPLLRVNRHNEELQNDAPAPAQVEPESAPPQGLPPPMQHHWPNAARPQPHRRSGPPMAPPMGLDAHPGHPGHPASRRRVATLQMMQQRGVGPTHRVLSRADLPANAPPGPAPVFLVYPVSNAERAEQPALASRPDSEPNKLDDLLEPLYGASSRGDDPVLKPARQPAKEQAKEAAKPPRADFPYAIEHPADIALAAGPGTAARPPPAVPAVADKRRDDFLDAHADGEINVIPYLQDYLPFATKRPPAAATPAKSAALSPGASSSAVTVSSQGQGPPARIVLGSGTSAPPASLQVAHAQPISATLHTVTPTPVGLGPPSRHETVIGGASGGSEFTVGAVMHTLSNHRHSADEAAEAAPSGPPSGTPSGPPVLDDHGFQAPFQASVSVETAPSVPGGAAVTPVEGWSVLSGAMRPGTVDKADIRDIIKETTSTDSSFDFENFKPQLFGGFKPILHEDDAGPAAAASAPSAAPVSSSSTADDAAAPAIHAASTDREERQLTISAAPKGAAATAS